MISNTQLGHRSIYQRPLIDIVGLMRTKRDRLAGRLAGCVYLPVV
jgi:hypothetical protein